MRRSRQQLRLASALCLLAATTACTPTTTTSALTADLPIGDDGWFGVAFEPAATLPDLVLTDTAGEEYNLRSEGRGRPTLLFFGYASCPDICAVHLAVLAQAMEQARIDTADIRVVFVSADPERDTPQKLADYLDNFDPGFVGLTGDIAAIERALRDLSLPAPTYSDPDDTGAYLVGHPAAFIAFDSAGNALRSYPFGTRRAQWVHDLPLLLEDQQ